MSLKPTLPAAPPLPHERAGRAPVVRDVAEALGWFEAGVQLAVQVYSRHLRSRQYGDLATEAEAVIQEPLRVLLGPLLALGARTQAKGEESHGAEPS
jgi:hypothetical protein